MNSAPVAQPDAIHTDAPVINQSGCITLQCARSGLPVKSPEICAGSELTFTAAQIAGALSRTPRAVRKQLQHTAPAAYENGRGGRVPKWTVQQLPASYRAELARAAQSDGCRDAGHFLSVPRAQAPARIRFQDAGIYYQVRAQKLQSALRIALLKQHEYTDRRAELAAIGLRDYSAAFGGDSITERHWWRLFDRTVARAGTGAQWENIDLYLDGSAAPAPKIASEVQPFTECAALLPVLQNVARISPTSAEQRLSFLRSFEVYEQRVATGQPGRVVKRMILDFLYSQVAGLAPNPNALRAKWELKHKAWLANGRNATALDDGRALRKGVSIGYDFDRADLELIAWHSAFNCAGKVSQGVRELSWMGDESPVSAAMREYMMITPSDKSGVPNRLRDAVTPLVKMLTPRVLGGLHKENSLAYLKRDWSRVKVFECFCADDFTWPVYSWIKNADGSYALTRGQCLLVIDARTLRILEYSLQPDRNYNSRVIRSLMTRVGENWAWPETWLFERGIWKESKLIHGSTALPWGEVEYGLERLGTRFIHAIHARTKPVERVGGAVQALMENLPGYCGREERHDCPEHTRKAKLMVERGGNPDGVFFSFEQWEAEFARICDRYNREIQNGDIIHNLSPEQALETLRDPNDEPRKFGPEIRWQLANHKSDKKVTTNGITLTFGRKSYVYRSTVTSELQHQIVRCYWDTDNPEYLTITDLADKNPRCVPLARDVHPLVIDDAYLTEAAKAEAHNAFPKVLFRTLKAKYQEFARPRPLNLSDPETADVVNKGAEMNRAQKEFKSQQKNVTSARRVAREIGMQISDESAARPESAGELRRLKEFLDENNTEPTAAAPVKTYVLNAPPASALTLPQLQKKFFSIWNQLRTLRPELPEKYRFDTCRKLTGVVAIPKMSHQQVERCIEKFSELLANAKKKEHE